MTLTERHWWAILVDAETGADQGRLEAHELSVMARVKLRDEFGINLDTVWAEAVPERDRLLEELRSQREKRATLPDLERQARDLLDRKV